MMAEYDNTNSGVLFRNDRRERDTQPEFTGNLDVGGVEYWLSAWVKESKAGRKFFKLSVQPKEPQPEDENQDQDPWGGL
jgi:hypothetical protein